MENKNNTALVRLCSNVSLLRLNEPEIVVSPDTDIFETPDAFTVILDIPGVPKEAITVRTDSRFLSVTAVQAENETGGRTLIVNERERKKYQREFRLGHGLNCDEITARVNDGVLRITLPKSDAMKARQIIIQ